MNLKTKAIKKDFSETEVEKEKRDRDQHIEDLFKKINNWFFNTDSTHFDPTELEDLEEHWQTFENLSDKQVARLEKIYLEWVCQS